LGFSDNITIENNISSTTFDMVCIFVFNDDIYRDNTFENNGAGVAVSVFPKE